MAALLEKLRERGFTLTYESGRNKLHVQPAERLNASLTRQIQEQRAELVAALVKEAASTPDAWEALTSSPEAAAWAKEITALVGEDWPNTLGGRLGKGQGLIERTLRGADVGYPLADLVALWGDLWLEFLAVRWRIVDDVERDPAKRPELVRREAFRVVAQIDPPKVPLDLLDDDEMDVLRRDCAGMVRAAVASKYGEGS